MAKDDKSMEENKPTAAPVVVAAPESALQAAERVAFKNDAVLEGMPYAANYAPRPRTVEPEVQFGGAGEKLQWFDVALPNNPMLVVQAYNSEHAAHLYRKIMGVLSSEHSIRAVRRESQQPPSPHEIEKFAYVFGKDVRQSRSASVATA